MLQGERSSLKFTATGGVDFFNQKNWLFFPPELQFEPNDGLLGTSLLTKSDNVNLNLQGGLIHTLTGGGFTATTSGGVQYARRDLDIDRTTGRNLVGGQSNVDAATNIAKEQQRELIKDLGYFLQEEVLTGRRAAAAHRRHPRRPEQPERRRRTSCSGIPRPRHRTGCRVCWAWAASSSSAAPTASRATSRVTARSSRRWHPPATSAALPGLVISTGNETGAADLRPERLREFEFGLRRLAWQRPRRRSS